MERGLEGVNKAIEPFPSIKYNHRDYDISDHGRMVRDRIRTGAYADALRRTVTPDSVVLDIGTGSGILALFACRFGARKVYAVESDDIIQVAKEAARANGVADRIEFIQSVSTSVALPEQVNVIVSDMHGRLPYFDGNIGSIIDARSRLLTPAGALIPRLETVWLAVASLEDLYQRIVVPWGKELHGFDLAAARRLALNLVYSGDVKPEQLLTDGRPWVTLDYTSVSTPNASAELAWTVDRSGTAHGIVSWFDSTLVPGVGLSNAPSEPETIYRQYYFPWLLPVELNAGDTVRVFLQAVLTGDQYTWRWDTTVLGQGEPRPKAEFRQSTFFGSPLSPERLRKSSADYQPFLTEDGRIEEAILSLMDGRTPAGQIAKHVARRFPNHFGRWEDALARVAELSSRFSGWQSKARYSVPNAGVRAWQRSYWSSR